MHCAVYETGVAELSKAQTGSKALSCADKIDPTLSAVRTLNQGREIDEERGDRSLSYASNEGELQPVDELLAFYAAGQLSPALYALVGAHLGLCPRNRAFVTALESLAASEISQVIPAPINGRAEKLSAILEGHAVGRRPTCDSPIPRALSHYIGQPFEFIRWRNVLPGIRECRIDKKADETSALLWIKAGRRIPAHTHEGTEITLVLQGGFSDQTGHYIRGDIAIADASVDHRPIADANADCLCFAVTDGRLRMTGPVGRLVERVFRPGH
jgi:putative transcriptional regulator